MELLHLAADTFNLHCPYNPSHTMPQKTFIKHLTRCPDKPPNFKTCTYNISHVMHESKLAEHEENCPNRILFDSILYESEDLKRPVPVLDKIPAIDYSQEESWEGLEQSCNVLQEISKLTVSMKAVHGSTKSERKKYRTLLHMSHNAKSGAVNSSTTSGHIKNKDELKVAEPKVAESKGLFIGKRPTVPRR